MRIVLHNIIILLLLTAFTAKGQHSAIFEHYSSEDGLSNGNITYIFEDSEGYMWFATWDGLNRFDGKDFTTFKTSPGDDVILSSNRIDLLVEDKCGYIWVLTYDQKTYRFDRRTETFDDFNKAYNKADLKIENIFLLSTDEIWLKSANQGLLRVITNTKDKAIKVVSYSKEAEEKKQLPDNNISRIFEDTKGNLWVFTDGGITCLMYNQKENTYSTKAFSSQIEQIIRNQFFTSVNQIYDNLIFGTENGELYLFNLENEQLINLKIPNNKKITSLHKGHGNNIYIGTNGNGMFRYNIIEKKVKAHNNSMLIKKINDAYIFEEEIVFIETENKGVIKSDSNFSELKQFQQKTDFIPTFQIRKYCTFLVDKEGDLWIMINQGGFGYYDKEKDSFEYFYNKPDDPYSKMSNYVTKALIDSRGIIWLNSYPKGLEKITLLQNKFKHLNPAPQSKNRNSNELRALNEDSRGLLWAATKDGLVYIFDKNYKLLNVLSDKNEIDHAPIYCIIEDKKGQMWLGSKGKGLFRVIVNETSKGLEFSTKNFKHKPNDSLSLSDDRIYSILEDKNDNIWIGTYGGGLNQLIEKDNNISFRNTNNSFGNYPEMQNVRIRHMQEDKNGNIWLATTQGLIMFNPNSNNKDKINFRHFSKIPGDITSLGSNNIFYIYRDKTDTLWLGTLGGGLQKMIKYPDTNTSPQFITYTKENGLPSNAILSIEEDQLNKLWISTENGLSSFNRKNSSFINYNKFDGLTTLSFSEATSCRRKNGELCFGTVEGIYYFFPKNLDTKEEKINLKLTRFSLFNQEQKPGKEGSPLKYAISQTKEIELNYEQSMFSVEYLGLTYNTNNKIQYTYILEGLDKSWHYVNSQNIATYTNIPPGKYLFRVGILGRDNNTIISEKTLRIRITPPPWKTKWAYFLYFILIIALIEVARRIITTMIRLRNKVVIEKALTDYKLKFFTNISHELRTPLTLIINPTEEIRRTEKLSEKGTLLIDLIDKNSKRMLRLINQLLDFRKIQNQKMQLKISSSDIVKFIHGISSTFNEMADEKKISFNTTSNIEELLVWFDIDKFDIVLFNLLSNAFKFTDSGSKIDIKINADLDKNTVLIEVSDEGKGIPAEKAEMVFKRFSDLSDTSDYKNLGSGIGLSLSKELIELHNGAISFKSIEGKGTSFFIELKLGKEHFDPKKVKFIEQNNFVTPTPLQTNTSKEDRTEINKDTSENNKRNLPILLIIEDNADLRKMLNVQFSFEYSIVEAEDGLIGYQKAIELIPDIIISDIMMQNMNGIEFIDKAKNDVRTSHIPIILLTSKSSVESKIEGLKYGADAYITKPFNSEILSAQIHNLINQRKLLYERFSKPIKLNKKDNTSDITEKDNEFLKQLIEVIEKNIENAQLNIDTLAKEVGMGRTLFFRKIKGLSGLSPIDFLKDYRLTKSEEYLRTGKYNISEVSYMVGFNDPGYFTKCFKEKYKATPSEYQKEIM